MNTETTEITTLKRVSINLLVTPVSTQTMTVQNHEARQPSWRLHLQTNRLRLYNCYVLLVLRYSCDT
ncbi:hypothetical protein H257_18064 [Aphanomyces astaci]|uniref:Uncharacterized protein n=1 Tax=Aphanomyces astaci TaxID=112090 RepID=W4FEJ8_APHAT|nr:hypothetical protein H257_18064 [Aphanomyces astaci]ETV65138.1 hypothetical protein H257_18064 [Aphanomyces astaci]|eukprot:XP_009845376.1 hypothetical protein H257_18064 [Aphanomyces astaci]